MAPMIEAQAIVKEFDDGKRGCFRAVDALSFQVEAGEIFGLLGPNGAGKTTFLRILAGILSPTSGSVVVNGHDVRRNPEAVKRSLGFMSGNTRLYGRMTPREVLRYFGSLYDMAPAAIERRAHELIALLDMESFADRRIEKLSTGQTQRTSIARCIFHEPPVLVLDEPTLGLDILTCRTILDFIRESARRGQTVLFSTHYMQEAEVLCDRLGLMHRGRLLAADTMGNLQASSQKNGLADVFYWYMESQGAGSQTRQISS